jgi:hypothetical protein
MTSALPRHALSPWDDHPGIPNFGTLGASHAIDRVTAIAPYTTSAAQLLAEQDL